MGTIFIQRGGDGYHTTRTRGYSLTSLGAAGLNLVCRINLVYAVLFWFEVSELQLRILIKSLCPCL